MREAMLSRYRQHKRPTRPNRTCLQVELLEGRDLLSVSPTVIPGELIVGFNPWVSQAEIRDFYTNYGFSVREALDQHIQGNSIRPKLVSVPAAQTTALISVLENDPRVAYAEPNYLIPNATASVAPTDPFLPAQFYLNNTAQFGATPDADIDAPEAWKITTGSPDVLVAVIDSRVNYNHPDLVANMWVNPFEITGDGIDNDGNGYVDDIYGINTITDSGDPMADPDGIKGYHGTAVAGIIGATPFNQGTVGVAWRVGIISIRLIDSANNLKTSDAVQAFQYLNYLKNVESQNIVASNNSWIWSWNLANSHAVQDAMAGLDQPGMSPILHICAAGNENSNNDLNPLYPNSFDLPNIISVAATDPNDHYASFSNYGAQSVDLAANGLFNLTTSPPTEYRLFDGTFSAAPQVTGAAALVASAFPGLSAAQIKERLLNGVDLIGQIGDNYLKPTLTNGRLNIAKALAGAKAENDNKPPDAVSNLTADATTFQSVTLTWTATGDDGSRGRASFYDIHSANSPITDATWDQATRVIAEPGPKTAGATETFTITGLDPSRTYYFALKARDNMGNQSGLSVVASGTTGPATTVFSDSMDNDTNVWTGSGLWHQSSYRVNSPTTAWYYGVEATHTYDTGAANNGTLTSPIINLKEAIQPILIYREWRQTEDAMELAQVQVCTGANKWETVHQSQFSTSVVPLNWQNRYTLKGPRLESEFNTPRWVSQAVDLSAYAGQTVRIRFPFDTGDAYFNNFEGWYVDDVNVYDAPSGSAFSKSGSSAGKLNSGSPNPSSDLSSILPGLPSALSILAEENETANLAVLLAVPQAGPLALRPLDSLFALLAAKGCKDTSLHLGSDVSVETEAGAANGLPDGDLVSLPTSLDGQVLAALKGIPRSPN